MFEVSLLADDTLVFLGGENPDFVRLFSLLEEFGNVSGGRKPVTRSGVKIARDDYIQYLGIRRDKTCLISILKMSIVLKFVSVGISHDFKKFWLYQLWHINWAFYTNSCPELFHAEVEGVRNGSGLNAMFCAEETTMGV